MSPKIKLILQRLTAAIFIILSFVACWKALRYILVDDSGSYTRITMHEFYDQENIDVLFMGASHCYRGFEPQTTDELLGCNTFNLGSSSQTIDVTYLLMKEAISAYDVDHIYLDLSYAMAIAPLDDSAALTSAYAITDYLHPSLRKGVFLLEKATEGNYANTFLVARRSWEHVFDPAYIKNVVSTKRNAAYLNFEYVVNESEWYAGKGFVACDRYVPDGTFKNSLDNERFDLGAVNEEWASILKEMILYCDEKNVDLTLVSVPISSYRLLCYQRYDEFIAFVEDIIADTGVDVEYIDFNLMRETYWDDTSELFMDYSHLNTAGAKQFSELFCRYINGEISHEELFYDSIAEKYAAIAPTFYGIAYAEPAAEAAKADCHLIMNRPADLITRISLLPESEDVSQGQFIKNWNDETVFQIPVDFTGQCRIEVANKRDPQNITVYTIEF